MCSEKSFVKLMEQFALVHCGKKESQTLNTASKALS